LWTVLLGLIVLPLAVLTVGSLTKIPVLSGGTSLNIFTFHITTATLILFLLALLALQAKRSAGRRLVVCAAAVAFLASAVPSSSMLVLARDHGINGAAIAYKLPGGEFDADVEIDAYTSFAGEDVGLSLWKPAGRQTNAGPAPVVVFVHGGGWVSGDRFGLIDMSHAKWLADQGYLVMSLDYSLSDAEHHNWNVQEAQIACALAWAQDHAPEYGGNTDRLGLMGNSAGGNLAFNTASKLANGTLESSCGGTVPEVDAVSVLYGGSPRSVWEGSDPAIREHFQNTIDWHIGGSPEQYPERYASLESSNVVNPATPPTFWMYGSNDHVVPYSSNTEVLTKMVNNGVEFDSLEVPFGDHLLDYGSIPGTVWRERTLGWFHLHGA